MTRLGWGILAGIALVTMLFLSTVSFGPAPAGGVRDQVRQALPFAHDRDAGGSEGLVVPVAGYPSAALHDSWGDARGEGTRAHQAIDIAAPGGTPVIAAAAGTVEKLFESRDGGTTLYVRSPDGRWSYYYAHLAGYAPGVREGLTVRAADPLGFVGDTGNAGAGNTHLHFGVSRMQPGDGWWGGEPVNPYPLLAGTGAHR